MFDEEMKSILASVVDGTSELASGFFNNEVDSEIPILSYYRDPSLVPNPSSDFTFDPATGTILKYIGLSSTVVIPYTIDGVLVEKIGDSSFEANTNVTSVEFPNTITSIGKFAFKSTRLITLTLPDSVETINEGSFGSISTLTTVKTGTGLKTIGKNSFYIGGLKIIELNEGLTTIGQGAFQLTKLEQLTIPSTVTNLGLYLAYNTPTLKNIIIPTSLKSIIINDTFDNSATKTYYADALVTTIGNYILNNKGVLVKYLGSDSTVTIPNKILGVTVSSIGDYAFDGNTNVTGVEFPNTITSIGKFAFNSTRLTTLTLPDSVETINEGSFGNIPTLTTVKTGTGLKTIGKNSFYIGGLTSIELNEGLTTIGTGAFQSTKLEILTIPSTVTNLGLYLAYKTQTLKTINIPIALKSKVIADTFDNAATKVYY